MHYIDNLYLYRGGAEATKKFKLRNAQKTDWNIPQVIWLIGYMSQEKGYWQKTQLVKIKGQIHFSW